MSNLAFEFDKNNNKLFVLINCTEGDSLPTDASIKAQFEESKYKEFFYFPEEASKAVALVTQYFTSKQFGKEVRFAIAEARPAKIKIRVAEDKMTASVELTAAFGGPNLNEKQIIKCATQKGVVMGIDESALGELVQKIKTGPIGEVYHQVIANGQLPKRGDDSTFEYLTKSIKDRVLQPQEVDHGKVDMRDLGSLMSVKPGDPLVRRHPPTKGRAGYNVLGKAVLAEPGSEIPFEIGSGSCISPQDPNLLISEIHGLPYTFEKGARVDNVLELQKIDVSTGHIDFKGGVIVNGDVSEGMKLKANGNVTIAGFVENAELEIDGDLTVMKGIIGRKTDDDSDPEQTAFQCNVKVSGNVCAKYIQNAFVDAGKQVQFQGQILHSRIIADSIYGGTDKSPAGKIVGGFYQVSKGVRCATIGAIASTNTIFHLYPELNEKLEKKQTLIKLLKNKEEILQEIKAAWEHLREDDSSENKAKLIEETIASYKLHDKELKKFSKAIEHLNVQIEKGMQAVTVYASREFFSKTHLRMGQVRYVSQDDMRNTKIGYKDGQFTKV
ncbi:FapA family protein [Catenovulum sp. 2E275]|uniref:FapA family protein n=1 Tax=Catenovulum sp. 2E275 TaxID=2980497 RepID=UPI0021CF5E78|nr:FapA family protein [Catenovulum sp. 2E275]MCU4676895.1 FapA family protein [Catenovulum sp. 2E275]